MRKRNLELLGSILSISSVSFETQRKLASKAIECLLPFSRVLSAGRGLLYSIQSHLDVWGCHNEAVLITVGTFH
jgi:hypothetical protein